MADVPLKTSMELSPTIAMNIHKNQGKTVMVEGKKGPGFFCELCNRICKDSARYLDHINGRTRE